MSRTFARLEVSVSQNGNTIKKIAEDVSCTENGTNEKDLSSFLNALQKTKDTSNEFLTTLVDEANLNQQGGRVISHSKRKHADDGKDSLYIQFIHGWFFIENNSFVSFHCIYR